MVSVLLLLMVIALAVPVEMFCLEVVLSLLPKRRRGRALPAEQPTVAVLIPAHSEEAVLEGTLRTLMKAISPRTRVLVVADNCTDGTAAIARQCGAETIERQDATRRGKGFALDFGIRHLAANPPDAVVFLDADCRVAPDTVRLLGSAAVASQRPVQGLNLCDPDPAGPPLQMISGLAFRFKNLVRAAGLARLADVIHLSGTGMALPWRLAISANFAHGNVVEDMQLGIDQTIAGSPPLFLPTARVDSPLPQQRSAARTQRTRWEHGHLRTIVNHCPRLFLLALSKCRLDLFWLALDLAIPPLSLLVLSMAIITGGASVFAALTGRYYPLAAATFVMASLSAAVLVGWLAHCRHQVPLFALLAAPFYAVAKLPIYFAFVTKAESRWVRTARDIART
jgi:hypothetical protein